MLFRSAMKSINFNTLMITGENPDFEAVLDLCDGFLVTGGIDVHPKWFNEEMNGTGEVNEKIDEIDKIVIDYALKTNKPMLGICRGHQVINVFMGGSLIQDIGQSHRNTRHLVKKKKNDVIDFDEEIEKLCYVDGKSDWIDLRAAKDVVLKKGASPSRLRR